MSRVNEDPETSLKSRAGETPQMTLDRVIAAAKSSGRFRDQTDVDDHDLTGIVRKEMKPS